MPSSKETFKGMMPNQKHFDEIDRLCELNDLNLSPSIGPDDFNGTFRVAGSESSGQVHAILTPYLVLYYF